VIPEGGCGLDAMQPRYAAMNRRNMDRARAEGRVFTTYGPPPDPEALRNAYGVPLTDEQVAFMAAPERNPQDAVNFYSQPVFWSAARDVPVTVVRQLRDPITPIELQDEMIARLPNPALVQVVRLDTGHIPAVTDVDAFAAIVDAAVASATFNGPADAARAPRPGS
jgi:pimeloyl-ACP methyl ester carboxylesterase